MASIFNVNLMKYINIPLFIVSLTLGLFVTYISTAPKTTIIVYPTVDNDDKILYKDKADNCFSFSHDEVECPSNEEDIFTIPVQV